MDNSIEQPLNIRPHRLLFRVLMAVRERLRLKHPVAIKDLIEPLGNDAPVLATVVVAIPFLFPFSVGPLTVPVFFLTLMTTWHLLAQNDTDGEVPPAREQHPPTTRWARLKAWVNAWTSRQQERILALPLPDRLVRILQYFLRRTTNFTRRFCKPRYLWITSGPLSRKVCAWAFVVAGFVLALPTWGVPLMNTLPALSLILLGLGWFSRDGLLIAISFATLALGTLLIATILIVVGLLGWAGAVALFGIAESESFEAL